MNKQSNKKISRWGLLATIAVILILLVGGAIYAQSGLRPGFGRGQGMQRGPRQNQPGFGRGQDFRQDQGRQDMGQHGPEAMLGLQFLMQDEEIKHMMAQIELIRGINRLGLTSDQVEEMKDLAIDAQDIVDAQFNITRDRIHEALENQLIAVARGEEPDREEFRAIMEEARGQHDPGEIKDALEDILNEAVQALSTEQLEMLMRGPDGEDRPMQDRMQDWRGQNQPGREWLDALDDETRAAVEEQICARMGEMQQNVAKMKLMMMLLSPDAVEAMEIWLDAN